MRRFYIEKIDLSRSQCVISGAEARHMTKVLRMKTGDYVVLMDGKGACFKARIESLSSREVQLSLEERLPAPPPSPVKITICQALPKARAMDYLIQKSSELGADRIVPFLSEHAVARVEKDRINNKMRHWNEIAINSAKQCGRSIPVKIEIPCPFGVLTEKFEHEDALKVVLWENESLTDLKRILRPNPSTRHFVGMIGPEGGFTVEEIETLKDAGFVSVSLGTRILRAETAAITMVAIVQYEMGDLHLNPTDTNKPA